MIKKFMALTTFILNLSNFSCGKSAIRAELPPENEIRQEIVETQRKELEKVPKENKQTFVYNYKLFRINMASMPQNPYTITNELFFLALSNEFDPFFLNKKRGPYQALKKYAALISSVSKYKTNAFLLQRVGVTYFKLGKKSKANRYLNKAILLGAENPEIDYYKAMLEGYYRKDWKSAAFYLKKMPEKSFYSPQNINYFKGRVQEEMGNFAKAEYFYKKAYAYSPARFMLNYNLQPFYVKWGHLNAANQYTLNSFKYLSSLNKPVFRLKAYRMLEEMHRIERKPTFSYNFKLSPTYPLLPNLFYFIHSSYPRRKIFSYNLALPILEKKKSRSDVLMYLTSENYADFNNGTGIVFTAGGLLMTNIRVDNEEHVVSVRRHFFYTNIIALITPTNRYYVLTNRDKSTNSPYYIVTNVDNKLFLTNDSFKTYIGTRNFDVNGDKVRDYLVFGIKNTNTINVDIFSPGKKSVRVLSFPIRTADARLVIQDFDGDGRNDILLFDDDVYRLSSRPESANGAPINSQTNQSPRPDSH